MKDQLELGLQPEKAPRRRRAAAPGSFHARSHVTAGEYVAGSARAANQEDAIVTWFKEQPTGSRFTPSEVLRAFEFVPLTSIRRALTNLATEREGRPARLIHHEADRRPGPYGAMESTWGLSQ